MIKCMLVATLIASLIFLIVDVIWLSFATKSFYRPLIGNLLTDTPVMWAAALFYILYVFGMALVVIQPCVDSDSLFLQLCGQRPTNNVLLYAISTHCATNSDVIRINILKEHVRKVVTGGVGSGYRGYRLSSFCSSDIARATG